MGFFDGVRNGIGAVNDYTKTRMLQEELRRYPEKLDLENQNSASKLKYQDITNQYLPSMSEAQIGNTRAHTGLYGAQTNLTNQESKYLPLKTLIQAEESQRMSGRFGGAYQLRQSLMAMPPAQRAEWIANNQQAYDQMTVEIGNQQSQQLITPQILQQYFPQHNLQGGMAGAPPPMQQAQQQMAQPMQSPPQNPAMMSAPGGIAGMQPPPQMPMQNPGMMPQAPGQQMPSPQPMQPQGMAAPPAMPAQRAPFTYANPAQLNSMGNTALLSANKELTTAATRRQLEGAIQVENIINDPSVQKQVVDASQYAGALRKGKSAIDALSQQNPEAYENYLAFKNQTMVLLQNRIKTLDQMGATDKQREELQGLYSKTMDSLTSNPSQFITQFNKLGNTLGVISDSVQKSASPVKDINRLGGFNPIKQDSDRVSIISPDGTKGTVPASQLAEAIKAGYKEG